jgi:hypothetical protein
MNRELRAIVFLVLAGLLGGVLMALLYLFVWHSTSRQAQGMGLHTWIAVAVGGCVGLLLSRAGLRGPFERLAPKTRIAIAGAIGLAIALTIALALHVISGR